MNSPINISIVNQSTQFADKDLPVVANALQIHMARDLFPLWGIGVRIFYTPTGGHPTPGHYILSLFDDADVANALGYHDEGPNGEPLGKVFVRTILADRQTVSGTICHEADEMVIDPYVDQIVQVGSFEYARESDDAVENDMYDVEIPNGWVGGGSRVQMSNFVTDAWFHPSAPGPYDFLGKLTKPLELSPGGYIGYRDLNNLSQGWQQLNAKDIIGPDARMKARPHVGSRRSLRAIPVNQRIRSTFSPGSVATPAGS